MGAVTVTQDDARQGQSLMIQEYLQYAGQQSSAAFRSLRTVCVYHFNISTPFCISNYPIYTPLGLVCVWGGVDYAWPGAKGVSTRGG